MVDRAGQDNHSKFCCESDSLQLLERVLSFGGVGQRLGTQFLSQMTWMRPSIVPASETTGTVSETQARGAHRCRARCSLEQRGSRLCKPATVTGDKHSPVGGRRLRPCGGVPSVHMGLGPQRNWAGCQLGCESHIALVIIAMWHWVVHICWPGGGCDLYGRLQCFLLGTCTGKDKLHGQDMSWANCFHSKQAVTRRALLRKGGLSACGEGMTASTCICACNTSRHSPCKRCLPCTDSEVRSTESRAATRAPWSVTPMLSGPMKWCTD